MRPFIHVNCAMSADGKLAGEDRTQVRISSDEDKTRVKALRKKYDAILVGVGTVLAVNAVRAKRQINIIFFIVPFRFFY